MCVLNNSDFEINSLQIQTRRYLFFSLDFLIYLIRTIENEDRRAEEIDRNQVQRAFY